MDVSSLGIQVQSTGIKEASSALSGLGTAAANAETKVTRLTDAVERLLKQNVTATMQAWTQSMNAMSNAMNAVGNGAAGYALALTNGNTASAQAATVTNNLNQQFNTQVNVLNNLTQTVNNYGAATNHAAAANEGWAARTGVMLNTLKAMTAAFLYYKAINIAESIVENADKWTLLNTRMITATGSQNNATVAMQSAYDISQKLGQPLDTTIKLYTRLAPAMAQLGHDSKDTNTMVTGLATSLRLGGASTAEANAAMLQFSHAMSAGSFNAREFNSLSREAPVLLRALADQMTNGNVHAVKTLMGASKVGPNEMLAAFQAAQPKWDAIIQAMPVTFEMAMTRIKNTWLKSIGEMSQDTSFNSELAKGLALFEQMIPAIVQGLATAFTSLMKWIDQNQDALKELGKQVLGLLSDVIKVGAGFFAWGGQIAGASGALAGVAYAVFTIRMGVAILQDVFMAVAANVVYLAAKLTDAFLSIPEIAADAWAGLERAIASLFDMAAKGAAALGKTDLANGFTQAATSAREGAANTDAWSNKLKGLTSGMKDFSANAVKDIVTGNEAISKLVNSASDPAESFLKSYKAPGKYDENANPNPTKETDPKALAAYTKEVNKNAEAVAALNTEYQKLLETQTALNASPNPLKVGPAQTELLRLQNELVAVQRDKILPYAKAQIEADLQGQIVLAERNATLEIGIELQQQQASAADKHISNENKITAAINDQVAAIQKRIDAFKNPNGKAAFSQDTLDETQRKLATAQSGLDNPTPGQTPADTARQQELVAAYQAQIEALQKLIPEQKQLGTLQAEADFDKLFDVNKTTKFTDAMTKGFGAAGKAVAGVANALRTASENNEKLAKGQALVNSLPAGAEKDARQLELNNQAQQLQMENYANLAQAAQGFFGKNTEGYKIMGAAEKAFRVAEMAMAIENFLAKSGFLTAFTGLFVTQQAVQGTAAVASTVPIVAAEGVKQTAYGVSALAASLTLPPPLSFATFAITAALLAGIGILVSGMNGHGSSESSAQKQATQGTGTVLGDTTKQSESITKSITLLANNSSIDLRYSSAMLASLQSIQSSLANVATQIFQNAGTNATVTGTGFNGTSNTNASTKQFAELGAIAGTVFGGAAGALLGGLAGAVTAKFTNFLNSVTGGLAGKLIGSSSKTTLLDSGITSGKQSLSSVLSSGLQAQAYQDTQTKSKSLFGLISGTSTNRATSALDPSVQASFTDVIKSMVNEVTQAGVALGMSSDDIAKKLSTLTVNLGDISLKGLTSDQIEKQLDAVFSAFGDTLVNTALGPMVSKFQQAGEGMLETAVRVASGVDTATVELDKLGLSAISFTDIVNTAGDVGAEIVRQTIELKEAGTGIGDIIQTMSGTANDIGDTYESLLSARRALQDLGIAKDVTTGLLDAAGGLDALQSSLDDYKKDFFTAAQQQAMSISDLTQQFRALGLTMPTTKDGFVALVNQLSASGAAGQALATQVIGLAGAFSDAYSTVDDAVSSATSDLTDAYNTQVDAINTAKTAFDGFATSLKTFKTSLMTGDLSVDDAVQKYQTEKALYEQTEAAAAAGDQTALSNFQDVAQAFLEASHAVYASGTQYTSDYQKVLTQTDVLQQYSAGQSSVEDQQLSALNQQVSGLITVNSSVLTVAQAIANLQAVMTTGLGSTSGFSFGGVPVPTTASNSTILPVTAGGIASHAGGLSMVPYDGYMAQLHKGERVLTAQENKSYQTMMSGASSQDMVTELKALRQEVSNLRSDQNKQTGDLINATYDSNAQNADVIVEGQKEACKDAAYSQRAKVTLA